MSGQESTAERLHIDDVNWRGAVVHKFGLEPYVVHRVDRLLLDAAGRHGNLVLRVVAKPASPAAAASGFKVVLVGIQGPHPGWECDQASIDVFDAAEVPPPDSRHLLPGAGGSWHVDELLLWIARHVDFGRAVDDGRSVGLDPSHVAADSFYNALKESGAFAEINDDPVRPARKRTGTL